MAVLQGRTALVTGASKGIGFAVARTLAGAGAAVAMVARTRPDLERAAGAVGGTPIPADVSDQADVITLVDRFLRDFGDPPDIVVNSAGSFTLAPFIDTAPEAFDTQLRINLRGPFLVNRILLPGMISRGSGHVIDIGSIAGRLALPGNAAYGASKFGLRGLHEVLALELSGTGVRTTLIEPAATDTPLWDSLDPDARDDLPSRDQMLRPDDVARAVLFAATQPAGIEISHLALRAV